MTLKPMLGTSITRTELEATLARIPLLASYKLDGIRALVKDGVVLSRSLKPIPNKLVQTLFGIPAFEGFDGELIVGSATATDVFRVTTSYVMSQEKQQNDVSFCVFDLWNMPNTPFHQRVNEVVRRAGKDSWLKVVTQTSLTTMEEVDILFNRALLVGHEGLVLRNPFSLYKFGRSTVKEAGLLKMKPFVDAEAECIGVTELLHNENPSFTNELGRTARSYRKEGKVPGQTLGSLVCRTPEGVEFEVGTGFSASERLVYWNQDVVGRTVKYKSLAIGVKEKPRHAVFLGFRSKEDM